MIAICDPFRSLSGSTKRLGLPRVVLEVALPDPHRRVACLGALFSPFAIAAVRSAPAGHDATTVAAITPVTTYVCSLTPHHCGATLRMGAVLEQRRRHKYDDDDDDTGLYFETPLNDEQHRIGWNRIEWHEINTQQLQIRTARLCDCGAPLCDPERLCDPRSRFCDSGDAMME